jgi:hypothetical protein
MGGWQTFQCMQTVSVDHIADTKRPTGRVVLVRHGLSVA